MAARIFIIRRAFAKRREVESRHPYTNTGFNMAAAGVTAGKSLGVDQMRQHILLTFLGVAGILGSQCPASAQTFSTYRCGDGSEFIAAFYEGDSRAHLQLDGKAVALPKRMSVSGSRYAKGGITLRVTKTTTTLRRGKQSTECKAQ